MDFFLMMDEKLILYMRNRDNQTWKPQRDEVGDDSHRTYS